MKTSHPIRFGMFCACLIPCLSTFGGSTVVLEGFEQGYTVNSQLITNIQVFTAYGTPRNNMPVSISIYTAAGPGDPRVTEGTNSAKIVFPADGFGNDFSLNLSDLACWMVTSAAASNQPGRYVIRYDVILENVNNLSYFNQHWFIANNWDYVRSGGGVHTNYNGIQFEIDSFSCAVELPGVAMPTDPSYSGYNSGDFASAGQIGLTGFCSDQFAGVTEPLNNFTIYIDNVRLVDTYGNPSDTPSVFPLQSFEGPNNLGGATVTDANPANTKLSLSTTNGLYNPTWGVPGVDALTYPAFVYPPPGDPPSYYSPAQESDFAVTDGTNCLCVSNTAVGYDYDIFSLPLSGTVLGQLINLNLPASVLAHYTIRWDLSTPYVPFANAGADGDYYQLDYNATTGSILPMSNGRRQTDNQWGMQRQTYSATLDQILYWGTSPALSVSLSAAAKWTGDPFYFDNFRLLDTQPKYNYITAQSYNAATRQFTVTWFSDPAESYTVQFSSSLPFASPTALAVNIPSGGFYTTNVVTVPAGQAGFIRIMAQ
jgi:hypothetical protein